MMPGDSSRKADLGSDVVTQVTRYELTEDESKNTLAEPRDCGFIMDQEPLKMKQLDLKAEISKLTKFHQKGSFKHIKLSQRSMIKNKSQILKNYSHQDSMELAQKQKYRPMEQDKPILKGKDNQQMLTLR